MPSKSVSISIPELMNNEIDALVKTGEYSSKSDVIRDAFRTFLRKNHRKKLRIAIELYKEGKISLMRAAEIAEIDSESFKQELRDRGITVKTYLSEEQND
ncbi:MAG: type II toxin-antitoxin system ParD family antitoxin [Thermoplasmata archaeon]